MRQRQKVLAILALGMAARMAGASPVDDLASPDPGIRASAAETIRKQGLYHPTSRDRWDKLLGVSKKGGGHPGYPRSFAGGGRSGAS